MPRAAKVKKPDDELGMGERFKLFSAVHWRGILSLVAPILLIYIVTPFPGELYMWVAYTLLVMGLFWVTECIPIAITGFIPLIVFPLRHVIDTRGVARIYVNDTILMFLGSLFLASSVEQSGFHKRLAYASVRAIGYSHFKLLLAMCCVTTFVSMWITNTAATTMMVPINFAILKVFEDNKILKIYEMNSEGELEASDITSCYFCAATFSATIGGIGTLVGTGTNLVFKGLFIGEYPDAPEYLSFPLFSAFGAPYMFFLEVFLFIYLIIVYLGVFRPGSDAAIRSFIPPAAKAAAKAAIERDTAALGSMKFHEYLVVLLFGGAMALFFCRSPQIFPGWADLLTLFFGQKDMKFILDSAVSMFAAFLMIILPSKLSFFQQFTTKYKEDMPKTSIISVLDWPILNREMPYSFMFLLGGGFSLSAAAKSSGLNDKLGDLMENLNTLPLSVVMFLVILVVIFVTNFASNIAVANVFVPICMGLAIKLNVNPLWLCIVAGFTASYCFMIPVGTPGNLIVQSAAKVPTKKMMVAGFGPTISTIFITWIAFYFYAPIIWPVVYEMPDWVGVKKD